MLTAVLDSGGKKQTFIPMGNAVQELSRCQTSSHEEEILFPFKMQREMFSVNSSISHS